MMALGFWDIGGDQTRGKKGEKKKEDMERVSDDGE